MGKTYPERKVKSEPVEARLVGVLPRVWLHAGVAVHPGHMNRPRPACPVVEIGGGAHALGTKESSNCGTLLWSPLNFDSAIRASNLPGLEIEELLTGIWQLLSRNISQRDMGLAV